MENIQLGEHVSVHEDRVGHIRKHGFNLNLKEIVELADKWTRGEEGVHVCHGLGKVFAIVIRGKYETEGKIYGKVRTIWDDEVGNRTERSGLPVVHHDQNESFGGVLTCEKQGTIPYAHGWCPVCDR